MGYELGRRGNPVFQDQREGRIDHRLPAALAACPPAVRFRTGLCREVDGFRTHRTSLRPDAQVLLVILAISTRRVVDWGL